ncbi:MAG: ribosomal protein S6 modification protein [Planctomycetota bacterium]|nr:MAG: ribosomal protein S6 modification protein [Planctomycetota bacterium]
MAILVVVDDLTEWPLHFEGVETVAARDYLAQQQAWNGRRLTVFNLCRSWSYQSMGWYVSLLASARGHRPVPSVTHLRDIASASLMRTVSHDLDELMQRSLARLRGDHFELSVYFGRNLAHAHDRLARALYNLFQVPFLRATFERRRERWELHAVTPIPARSIARAHREFVIEAAKQYFARYRPPRKRAAAPRHDLAILVDAEEASPPSDSRALARFQRAAEQLGMRAQVIHREDYGRLAEFDALFIRVTTAVNHYTYDFARRAEALGLVVIDDPTSILRCTNKVFLAELLERHEIEHPRSLLVNHENLAEVADQLGLPCVLKKPDSAFSQGVVKADSLDELISKGRELLATSELVVAQEFLPTEFDWRVGVLDRKPLYVARYHMAAKHWQIIRRDDAGGESYGRVQALAVDEAPRHVVRTAVRAANLIGDGLYGVDLKTTGRKCHVIEVNDNPSLDAGYEDSVLGARLYQRVMEVFLQRIEARKSATH